MSKVRFVVESLKTANYIVAAAAVAGTVMMPIPPARAGSAGIATTAATVPLPRPAQARTAGNAPLDLAAVARMAPAHIVARAQALAAGDTIGILTREQIVEFANSNPAFAAKLQHAYLTGTEPQLTAEERQILAAVSAAALGDIKAGTPVSSPVTTPSDDNGPRNALFIAMLLFFLFLLIEFGFEIPALSGLLTPHPDQAPPI
jgi:hypothetical protein